MIHTLLRILLLLFLTGLGADALRSGIINGKKSKSKLYMASVQNNNGHKCGGFLISEDFVVTAAHCDKWNPTTVVLGTNNLKKVDETMRYGIKKCKHPAYKDIKSGNDIMLLQLSRKAKTSKKAPIKPVQIPSHQMDLKKNKKCTVAGWGLTGNNGEVVDKLREVDVPIINMQTCQKMWGYKLPSKVICAGGYESKKGFCQGDSGGPLVCSGKLAVGVASFNNNLNCNYPDVPNVYTDISKFLPWINEILKKKKC